MEAKFACDDIGGELVVITSATENEFVRCMAKGNLIWLVVLMNLKKVNGHGQWRSFQI